MRLPDNPQSARQTDQIVVLEPLPFAVIAESLPFLVGIGFW